MTHRFLTHFSTVFFIHMALIFGGLTILHNDEVTRSIGQRIINFKMGNEDVLVAPRFSSPVKERRATAAPTEVASEAPATPDVKPGSYPESTTSALSGTAIADIKLQYKSELRSKIEENKFYPMAARRMGQQGTSIVAFTLLEDGSIINVRIDTTSGNDRLDSAALEAVKKVGKFKAIPSEFGPGSIDMSVPIKFQTI